MLGAATTGFGVALSLILAIGAQNAFVLRQGLQRAHVLAVCLICAVSDAILIALGVLGFEGLTRALPAAVPAMTWGGALFLIGYGALSLRRALRPGALRAADRPAGSLGAAVLTCLALTWANPHVYLDTVGLIGAVSTRFEGEAKLAFALGAMAASFAFFFALGYGARLLAPIFARPRAWQMLDFAIAVVMWAIAAGLIRSQIAP